MTTAEAIRTSLKEYMETGYRPDREWVDGELRVRNLGKYEHARIQALLTMLFGAHEKDWGVKVVTEQRSQVSPTRIRIPDVMLLPRGPQPEVIVTPPILVVEILSPEDTYSDTQQRAADYLQWGAPVVWIIDPTSRTGRQCIGESWTATDTLVAPGTQIQVNLPGLFRALDED